MTCLLEKTLNRSDCLPRCISKQYILFYTAFTLSLIYLYFETIQLGCYIDIYYAVSEDHFNDIHLNNLRSSYTNFRHCRCIVDKRYIKI